MPVKLVPGTLIGDSYLLGKRLGRGTFGEDRSPDQGAGRRARGGFR